MVHLCWLHTYRRVESLLFLDFMAVQLRKSLSLEIQKYKASHNKGFSFMF